MLMTEVRVSRELAHGIAVPFDSHWLRSLAIQFEIRSWFCRQTQLMKNRSRHVVVLGLSFALLNFFWAPKAASESSLPRHGEGVPDGVPLVIRGQVAPPDFVEAQCFDWSGVKSCMLKVDREHQAIALWRPPGRESSSLSIYRGTCLDAGCVLQNPDHGYPERYRGTTTVVSWSGERGGLLLKQSHGYALEIVPRTPLSF